MLVRDIMRSPAVAIPPETRLQDAYRILREKAIRHLPVLEGGRLVGVVTDRDLRLATSALAPAPFPPESRRFGRHVAQSPDGGSVGSRRRRRPHHAREEDRLPAGRRGRTAGRHRHRPGPARRADAHDGRSTNRPGGSRSACGTSPESSRVLTGFLSQRGLNIHSILTYSDGPDNVRVVLRVGSIETRLLAEDLRRADFDVVWPPEKPCPR